MTLSSKEIAKNKNLIERAYWRLRARIEQEVEVTSWIWQDWFLDTEIGLDYFFEQIQSDEDFKWIASIDPDTTIEEQYAEDISDDVYRKIMRSAFIHSAQQSMR